MARTQKNKATEVCFCELCQLHCACVLFPPSGLSFYTSSPPQTQLLCALQYHLGRLKAKVAKLKSEVMAASTKSGGKAGDGFDVTKSGDTRVGLIGFPSVGKSTLLTTLTGTESLAASYEFTTLTAIPGTLNYKGARIQIVDLPGIIEGAKDGKGRGRQVIGTARTCELILIVLDASKPVTQKKIMERELEGFGIRLNKKPPNIVFVKKAKGGLTYRNVAGSKLDEEAVSAGTTVDPPPPFFSLSLSLPSHPPCSPSSVLTCPRPPPPPPPPLFAGQNNLLGVPHPQCRHNQPRAQLHGGRPN